MGVIVQAARLLPHPTRLRAMRKPPCAPLNPACLPWQPFLQCQPPACVRPFPISQTHDWTESARTAGLEPQSTGPPGSSTQNVPPQSRSAAETTQGRCRMIKISRTSIQHARTRRSRHDPDFVSGARPYPAPPHPAPPPHALCQVNPNPRHKAGPVFTGLDMLQSIAAKKY